MGKKLIKTTENSCRYVLNLPGVNENRIARITEDIVISQIPK